MRSSLFFISTGLLVACATSAPTADPSPNPNQPGETSAGEAPQDNGTSPAATSSSPGASAAATSAQTNGSGQGGEPAAPHCLPDLGPCEDIRDTANPPVDPSGKPMVFDCYGACGASCNMVNKSVSQTQRCQDWPGATSQHRLLTYELVTGGTHEFCTFHDACYMQCNVRFLDTDPAYSCCTAYCDYGCENPLGFNDSCDAGKYQTDHGTFWGAIAFQRVCGNVDDYVPATCKAGKIPDAASPTWSHADCAVWATTAAGIDPGSLATITGKTTFTKLVTTGDWAPGPCPTP
jgi:hypothetical protein